MRGVGIAGETQRVRRGVFYVLLTGAVALACENLDGLSGGASENAATEERTRRDSGSGTTIDGDPVTVDASAPRCDRTKPFGDPKLVEEFDPTAHAKGAVMTPDELEAFYVADAPTQWTLRHARRASQDAPWEVTSEPMSPQASHGLSLSAGGRKLYYWLLEGTTNAQPKVFVATRGGPGEAFGAGQFFSVPNGRPIFVVESDDVGYVAIIETPAGGNVINETIKSGPLTGGSLINLTDVPRVNDIDAYDAVPVLNADQTALYFRSGRQPSLGSDDVWVAHRESKLAAWGEPEHVVELSSAALESVSWVSNDECVVLLDRSKHVFMARRPQ